MSTFVLPGKIPNSGVARSRRPIRSPLSSTNTTGYVVLHLSYPRDRGEKKQRSSPEGGQERIVCPPKLAVSQQHTSTVPSACAVETAINLRSTCLEDGTWAPAVTPRDTIATTKGTNRSILLEYCLLIVIPRQYWVGAGRANKFETEESTPKCRHSGGVPTEICEPIIVFGTSSGSSWLVPGYIECVRVGRASP